MRTSIARERLDATESLPAANECPDRCPRCDADLTRHFRVVNLVVVLEEGEHHVTGHACARCGWCCTVGL